jgi:hypothetical protein
MQILATTAADWEFLHGSGPGPDSGSSLAGSVMWAIVLAAAGTAGMAFVIVALIRRDRARHGATVRHLSHALGLSLGQRRLVHHVACVVGVREVGSLLISRGCFDRAVERYMVRFGRAAQLAAIRRTIFDD